MSTLKHPFDADSLVLLASKILKARALFQLPNGQPIVENQWTSTEINLNQHKIHGFSASIKVFLLKMTKSRLSSSKKDQYPPPDSSYSPELLSLIKAMLCKDAHMRPMINKNLCYTFLQAGYMIFI